MAGLRGNIAYLMAQKQTAKGAVAVLSANSAFKMPYAGGNIGPVRETDQLQETDSSRDRGVTFVQSSGVEGSPEFYARDRSAAFWLWAGLGGIASTTVAPNYTHTITPANLLPYITCWRNISDTLYETYRDCKVGSLMVSAEAGQPLTIQAGIQGLQSTRLTTAPDTSFPQTMESGAVYNFNEATVTLGGAATALVRSFELSIENNVQRQQTDDVVPYDVYEGTREVTLSFDLIFESLDEYNKFHYGSASGTAITSNVFTTSAAFTFDKGANNQIGFNFPSLAYTEFPVEPSASGDPVTVSVSAAAQRGASPVVTATVKNQTATY